MLRSALRKVMWVGKATSAVVGLAIVLALLFGMATAAFGADGGNFIIGQTNVATLVTRLAGQDGVDGAMFEVQNNNSGTDDTALSLKVQPGEVPMTVNRATKVTNLNADKLDGLDSLDFQGKYARTVVVAKSRGDFTSVQAALNSITDAGSGKHYLVWVGPGTYNGRVQMKPLWT